MKLLIDPFTNKPKEFAEYAPDGYKAMRTLFVNGKTDIELKPFIVLEVEYNASLLDKTYDPETNTLI